MTADPSDPFRAIERTTSTEVIDLSAMRTAVNRLSAFRSGGVSFSALVMALIAPFNGPAADPQPGDEYSQPPLDAAASSEPEAFSGAPVRRS